MRGMRRVVAVDKETGLVVRRHDSLLDAARAWDMSYVYADSMVARHAIGSGRVMLRWADEWRGCEKVFVRRNAPVRLRRTGDEALVGRWYPTVKSAAAALHLAPVTISTAMRSGSALRCGIVVERVDEVRHCALDEAEARVIA